MPATGPGLVGITASCSRTHFPLPPSRRFTGHPLAMDGTPQKLQAEEDAISMPDPSSQARKNTLQYQWVGMQHCAGAMSRSYRQGTSFPRGRKSFSLREVLLQPPPPSYRMGPMRAAAVFLLALLLPLAGQASTLDRDRDPVVMTGLDLPSFSGVPVDRIAAFRYQGGWIQIPVQVDERDVVDFRDVYNNVLPWPVPIWTLAYTDPTTYTGPDSDPLFDDDDELVFMAADAGERVAYARNAPAGLIRGLRPRGGHHRSARRRRGLRLPLRDRRHARSRRGRELRDLHVRPPGGVLPPRLRPGERSQPRGQRVRLAALPDPLLRPLDSRRAGSHHTGLDRDRHPRSAQEHVRAGRLPAHRGHLQQWGGSLLREHQRAGAFDPLLHGGQQRPAHPAGPPLLRGKAGHHHLPARPRHPRRDGPLRLQPRRDGDDLLQRSQPVGRDRGRHLPMRSHPATSSGRW